MSRPMSKFGLVLPASILFTFFLVAGAVRAQQPAANATAAKTSIDAVIPAEAARQSNPVKPTQESLDRGKKWWTIDCAMCHGSNGDGKGETGRDMKLTIADFTDPATLKDRTDGELFYIIKNGHRDMPPEGPRVKTEENWDLVNYVRSLAQKKDAAGTSK